MKTRVTLVLLAFGLIAALAFATTLDRSVAWKAAPVEGGFMYTIAGGDYGPYGSIDGRPWIAPDFSHWACSFQGKDGTHVVLVDGKEVAILKGFPNGVWSPVLSADGKHWALTGADAKRTQSVVVDGKAYGPFTRAGTPVFLPGGHWRADLEEGKTKSLLLDGKKYGPYAGGFMGLAFDRAGAPGFDIRKADGTSWFWSGGKENGPYAAVEPVMDPAGYLMGFSGKTKAGKLDLVIYGKKYGPYDYYQVDRLSASVDGKDWMILVTKAGKQYLLQNGKEATYNRCAAVRLSSGTLFYYEKGMGQYYVYNGKTLGPFETGRDFTVSKQGADWGFTHIVYSKDPTKPDVKHVVVNGVDVEGTSLAKGRDTAGDYLAWVSGGVASDAVYHRIGAGAAEKALYKVVAAEGGVMLVSDAGSLGPYESVASQPWVAPDGAHWGVLADRGSGYVLPIVDGAAVAKIGPYDKVYDFRIGPSGANYSFVALKVVGRPNEQTRVIDGVEYGPFSWAGQIDLGSKPGAWHLMAQLPGSLAFYHYVSGERYEPSPSGVDRMLADTDGGAFVMVLGKKDGKYLWKNGKEAGPYKEVEILYGGYPDPDAGARDAPYLGYVAVLPDGTTQVFLAGGGKFGPYAVGPRDRQIWVAADGSRYAIVVRKDDKTSYLIADGKEAVVGGTNIIPLASGYALARFDGKAAYYGEPGAELGPYTGWNFVHSSADKAHWVVETGVDDGKSWRPVIVLDGKEYPGDSLRMGRDAAGEFFSWTELDADNNGWLNVFRM